MGSAPVETFIPEAENVGKGKTEKTRPDLSIFFVWVTYGVVLVLQVTGG